MLTLDLVRKTVPHVITATQGKEWGAKKNESTMYTDELKREVLDYANANGDSWAETLYGIPTSAIMHIRSHAARRLL
tara:strand:- start:2454 stop:2684 length:231 start_codon:yes stop_codon:yes gene_type:complete